MPREHVARDDGKSVVWVSEAFAIPSRSSGEFMNRMRRAMQQWFARKHGRGE